MKKVLFLIFLLTNLIILGCVYFDFQTYEQAEKDYDEGNYAQAFQGFKKICDANQSLFASKTGVAVNNSCVYVGNMYLEGKGITPNYKEGLRLLKKYCDHSSFACVSLGAKYREGKGVEQDYKKAFKLFEKACNDKYSDGCSNLALMYYLGEGVEQSNSKAKEYFEKSCSLRSFNNEGCDYYRTLDIYGY